MGINITINAGKDASQSSVSATGVIQHVITDEEYNTFKLSDDLIKKSVEAYFGKYPDDAYLHGPTPWNNLYTRYNWPEVQMMLVVQKAEILGITSEPIIIKSQEFSNLSSKVGVFNVNITDSVTETVSNSWTTGGTLSIEKEIHAQIGFLGTEAGGINKISYEQSWGVAEEQSKEIQVGSSGGVSVELQPGETILAELCASRGVMRVRITYNAYLSGFTAVNYGSPYKDHHFWGLDFGNVMSAGSISNSVQSTQDITIGYYSSSKIELKDKVTNALKASFMLIDKPGR